jgi:hypothetical protein
MTETPRLTPSPGFTPPQHISFELSWPMGSVVLLAAKRLGLRVVELESRVDERMRFTVLIADGLDAYRLGLETVRLVQSGAVR